MDFSPLGIRTGTIKISPNSLAAQIAMDPSASYWLKDALKKALDRDPVDALNDAEALALALKDNLQLIRGRHHGG